MGLLGNAFKKVISKVAPPWWQVTGNIESYLYMTKKRSAETTLANAKRQINSTADLAAWYGKSGLRYKSEKVDMVSLPWVAIAKGGGDCDDFMSLSFDILSSKRIWCKRVVLYANNGSGHAVVVAKEGSGYVLMSNMTRKTGFATIDAAARDFYGANTKTIIYI